MAPKLTFMQPTISSTAKAKPQSSKRTKPVGKTSKNVPSKIHKKKAVDDGPRSAIWDIEPATGKDSKMSKVPKKRQVAAPSNSEDPWELKLSQNPTDQTMSVAAGKQSKPQAKSKRATAMPEDQPTKPKPKRTGSDDEYIPPVPQGKAEVASAIATTVKRDVAKPTVADGEKQPSPQLSGSTSVDFSSGNHEYGDKTLVEDNDPNYNLKPVLEKSLDQVGSPSKKTSGPTLPSYVSRIPVPMIKSSQSAYINASAVPEKVETRERSPSPRLTEEQLNHIERVYNMEFVPTEVGMDPIVSQALAKYKAMFKSHIPRRKLSSGVVEKEARKARVTRAHRNHRAKANRYDEVLANEENVLIDTLPRLAYSPKPTNSSINSSIPTPTRPKASSRRYVPRPTLGNVQREEEKYQDWRAATLDGEIEANGEVIRALKDEVELEIYLEEASEREQKSKGMPLCEIAKREIDAAMSHVASPTRINMKVSHTIASPEPFVPMPLMSIIEDDETEDIQNIQTIDQQTDMDDSPSIVAQNYKRDKLRAKVAHSNDRVWKLRRRVRETTQMTENQVSERESRVVPQAVEYHQRDIDQMDRPGKKRKGFEETQSRDADTSLPPTSKGSSHQGLPKRKIAQFKSPSSSQGSTVQPQSSAESQNLSKRLRKQDDAYLVFQRQLLDVHEKRDQESKRMIKEYKGELRKRKLETLTELKEIEDQMQTKYAEEREKIYHRATKGVSTMKTHVRNPETQTYERVPADDHPITKEMNQNYAEITGTIDDLLQKKESHLAQVADAKAQMNEYQTDCRKIVESIQDEVDLYDFQYGVAIHGEDAMKRKYRVPKGYKPPKDTSGIIPRFGWIREKVGDMIQTAPNVSEEFYQGVVKSFLPADDVMETEGSSE